jgi:hypothetical protein
LATPVERQAPSPVHLNARPSSRTPTGAHLSRAAVSGKLGLSGGTEGRVGNPGRPNPNRQ